MEGWMDEGRMEKEIEMKKDPTDYLENSNYKQGTLYLI